MRESPARAPEALRQRLLELYQPLVWDHAAVEALREVYAPDVTFRDPIQTTHGLEGFLHAMHKMVRSARGMRFVFQDSYVSDSTLFFTWKLSLTTPLSVRPVVVEACSQVATRDGWVVFHRDWWDLLESVMGVHPASASLHQTLMRVLA